MAAMMRSLVWIFFYQAFMEVTQIHNILIIGPPSTVSADVEAGPTSTVHSNMKKYTEKWAAITKE